MVICTIPRTTIDSKRNESSTIPQEHLPIYRLVEKKIHESSSSFRVVEGLYIESRRISVRFGNSLSSPRSLHSRAIREYKRQDTILYFSLIAAKYAGY